MSVVGQIYNYNVATSHMLMLNHITGNDLLHAHFLCPILPVGRNLGAPFYKWGMGGGGKRKAQG